MNSLSELNAYANTGITFVDERPTSIVFSPAVPITYSTTTYESVTPVQYVIEFGTHITDIINRTSDLSYSIDLTSLPSGANISCGTLPAGLTLSHVGKVYTISGIKSVKDWKAIVAASPILFSPAPFGNTDKNVIHTINYEGTSLTWTTTIIALFLNELSTATSFTYTDNVDNLVSGTPTILELGPIAFDTSSYTLTVSTDPTFFNGSLSSSGVLGGTTTWSAITGNLTVTGNMSQVSSHLSHLYYLAPAAEGDSSMLFYSLYNPAITWTSTTEQFIESSASLYLTTTTPSYYDKNLTTAVSGATQIIDVPASPSDVYTMTVTSLTTGIILSMLSTGSGGTSTFTGETLTITGTKVQVNERLLNLSIQNITDYASPFYLIYSLTTPTAITVKRSQAMYVSNNNTAISNLNVSRSFVSNTGDQVVFSTNTPQIIETVSGTPSYTISLTSSAGKFGFSPSTATATFTYTGTKSSVNSIFSTILFYPYIDVSSTQTANYTQSRDGVTELSNQTISLVGTARSTSVPGAGTYTYTANTVATFTYEQANYLYADVLIVGGGGGAGAVTDKGGYPGAGGGGGVYQSLNTHVGVSTTIVIGAKGLGGGWTNNPSYTVQAGTNGGNSSISYSGTTITAYGGVAGGTAASYQSTVLSVLHTYKSWSSSGNSGAPTTFTGHASSVVDTVGGTLGGMGPGYPAPGAGATPVYLTTNGLGGAGVYSSITAAYYGGGGSGTVLSGTLASRSVGGGGASDGYGGGSYSATSYNALANTGGGGGTGGQTFGPATGGRGVYGNGAAGIVVIKFHS